MIDQQKSSLEADNGWPSDLSDTKWLRDAGEGEEDGEWKGRPTGHKDGQPVKREERGGSKVHSRSHSKQQLFYNKAEHPVKKCARVTTYRKRKREKDGGKIT